MYINEEIRNALASEKPVVALETTIISHGMPYPKNIECALMVEKIIRDNGAIPATIGIIDGEIIVGMNKEQIKVFGKKQGISKVSRRDLPIITSQRMWGATTVSATMIIASLAGIQFFVTGGIGGCQKGAETTFDISADLEELSRTNVTVICAGPKAILDLELTIEILETKGVPVIGYKSDKLPAFYTRQSHLNVDYNAQSPKEIAQIHKNKRMLKLDGGILVCNPVPQEFSMNENEINEIINKAQEEMELKGIKGKDETPFLLKRIGELTNGESLNTNIELIKNNARLGALIAKEYCLLK